MKAEDKAGLALGLAWASTICMCVAAVPAMLLASSAMKQLPKESPAYRRSKFAILISAVTCGLWLVIGIVGTVLSPPVPRIPPSAKGGKVNWEDLQIGQEYKLLNPAMGFDSPTEDGRRMMDLPKGEPVVVIEKSIEKNETAKRNYYWVKVETVQFSRGRKGDVITKDVRLWLQEPSLEVFTMPK